MNVKLGIINITTIKPYRLSKIKYNSSHVKINLFKDTGS